ncbi:hypothetical protein FIA58_005725 [Flavobacterium jejuense]|uniref:Peptidase M56 domain-containing protein n=1 Tax=Flavobacterium jejuense TaxID=1544455 RepID=A0ABX0IN08_9FLAO|nr:M56 family metallopeptidase [Flavobacterium jejuense]NHN25175.1 hypothetical protein [Flavobacterium jejuense]
MENVLFYFLKVNGLLLVFYLAYYIFLRKETFFQSNRWFLLLGIMSAFVFPLISFTTIIWIEPEPIIQSSVTYSPIRNFESQPIEEPFNWNILLFTCYTIVSLFFLTKLTVEIASFFKIIKNGKKSKSDNIVLVETNESQNPFSFFNYLVFNQSHFSEEELNMILIHEKIHIQQKHSIDVLIGKLLCLLFWINPIVWFYRKAILENLEYIADNQTALLTNNLYVYQKTLLKAVVCNHQLTITNQFYQSLIKKRIVMLNQNQSNRKKLWKYSLIIPFLVAFVLLFQIETIAQVKEKEDNTTQNTITSSSTKIESKIDKNSTDKELKELGDALNEALEIQLEFDKIKRNKKNEITRIKVSATTDKSYKSVIELDETEGIEPFTVIAFENDKKEKIVNFIKNSQKSSTTTSSSVSTINNNSVVIKYDGWRIEKYEDDKEPVLFIVNGNKQATGSNINFDYTVKVLNSKELNEKEALKKYGNAGKNGAYEFTIEKRNDTNHLYIINGKEYTSNDLKGKKVNLDGSIAKLSDKEGKEKYGKKGRNGVSILNGKAVITDNGKKDVIYIRSKNELLESNSNQELPEPPTPPTPPSHVFEKVRKAPTPPSIPETPKLPSNLEDEKEMKKFEEKMAVFEMKMKKMEPQFAKFEKEMEVYEMEMEGFEPDMKAFEKQMKEFEKKMEVYQEKLMEKLEKENEFREEKIERIIERKVHIDKKREAIEAEKMAMKAHKATIKSKIEAEEAKVRAERAKRKTDIEKRIAEEQKKIEEEQKRKAGSK